MAILTVGGVRYNFFAAFVMLDLALVGGTIKSEHIVAEPLFYEKYTAICAPEHPMAGKTAVVFIFTCTLIPGYLS